MSDEDAWAAAAASSSTAAAPTAVQQQQQLRSSRILTCDLKKLHWCFFHIDV
jgi:hypothetical protein